MEELEADETDGQDRQDSADGTESHGTESKHQLSIAKRKKTSNDKVRLSIGDVVIIADKQRLMEMSPYFTSLLRFHADAILDLVPMIPPENVHVDSFVAMLNYLSSSRLKLDLDASNVWDFIVLSRYFQLDQVEETCLSVLRKAVPELSMDELCQLWRKGYAYGFDTVLTLAVAGISLKMEDASQSEKFLDFTVVELVALMSGDGFLPVEEADVCKAVYAWCDHDPDVRKRPAVLDLVLAEVVWGASKNIVFQPLFNQCGPPVKVPKRAIDSGRRDYEIPSNELFNEFPCGSGIIVGDYFYTLDECGLYRIDLKTKERTVLDQYGVEIKYRSFDDAVHYLSYLVKLPHGDHIGCLVSYYQDIRYGGHGEGFAELCNTIALYGLGARQWTYLPKLPLPRINTAVIQLGAFLYVIGGTEYKPYEAGVGNAHHCYRLDLTVDSANWVRIADLRAPRKEHNVKIHYGRIIAYGGKTKTKLNKKGQMVFEQAYWSEAYDTVLDTWALLTSS